MSVDIVLVDPGVIGNYFHLIFGVSREPCDVMRGGAGEGGLGSHDMIMTCVMPSPFQKWSPLTLKPGPVKLATLCCIDFKVCVLSTTLRSTSYCEVPLRS